ncbi:MAG: hypothetical protein AB8E15_06740 [Bdellovibrionales bacterium]
MLSGIDLSSDSDLKKYLELGSIDFYKQLESMSPFFQTQWAARINAKESLSYQLAVAKVYEQISEYVVARRGQRLRKIALGVQEVLWNLQTLRSHFQCLEDHSLVAALDSAMEFPYDILDYWGGHRSLAQLICIGGVTQDLSFGGQSSLRLNLKKLTEEMEQISSFIVGDPFLESILKDQLVIPNYVEKTQFQSGFFKFLENDSDRDQFLSYLKTKEKYNIDFKNDAYVRLLLLLFRLVKQVEVLSQDLVDIPEGDHRVEVEHLHIPGELFAFSKVEAPSGDLHCYFYSSKIRFSSFGSRIKPHLNRITNTTSLDVKLSCSSFGLNLNQGAW